MPATLPISTPCSALRPPAVSITAGCIWTARTPVGLLHRPHRRFRFWPGNTTLAATRSWPPPAPPAIAAATTKAQISGRGCARQSPPPWLCSVLPPWLGAPLACAAGAPRVNRRHEPPPFDRLGRGRLEGDRSSFGHGRDASSRPFASTGRPR